jgi:hypothetical protein
MPPHAVKASQCDAYGSQRGDRHVADDYQYSSQGEDAQEREQIDPWGWLAGMLKRRLSHPFTSTRGSKSRMIVLCAEVSAVALLNAEDDDVRSEGV